MKTLRHSDKWVFSAVDSPDGRHVLTAGDWTPVRLWDLELGTELRTVPGIKRR